MEKIQRFRVCLRCSASIPILPEINFYEFEKYFNNEHRGHSIVIMTEKELFAFAERQALQEKIYKNAILLRNLKYYKKNGNPNPANKLVFNSIRKENIELLKLWSNLNC